MHIICMCSVLYIYQQYVGAYIRIPVIATFSEMIVAANEHYYVDTVVVCIAIICSGLCNLPIQLSACMRQKSLADGLHVLKVKSGAPPTHAHTYTRSMIYIQTIRTYTASTTWRHGALASPRRYR